jgi:hypothetical protein
VLRGYSIRINFLVNPPQIAQQSQLLRFTVRVPAFNERPGNPMTSRRNAIACLASSTTLLLSIAGCSAASSSTSGSSPIPPTVAVSISPAVLNFTATAGLPAANQVFTLTNTGTVSFVASGGTLSSAPPFSVVNSTCGASVAVNATCTITIGYAPTGSGILTGSLVESIGTTTVTGQLTGTAIGSATTAATVDCSLNAATCPNTFTGAFTTANSQLASDPIGAGLFHGYADPSIRKDPNSTATYYAYSWAHTLADGTHVVDLHLAQSTTNGATFTYAGPLYQSVQTTQTGSTAYSSVNDSSTETVDLLPIPLTGTSAGQTMWVQAHQSYLVKPTGGIYDQLNATSLISVTAVQLTAAQEASPALAATAMLGLSTAPEARLGAAGTDPTRNITQSLSSFNATTQKCANWGQPALWYQSPNLYLALECTEFTGSLDINELAHFLFVTTPTGTNASTWSWALAAEFATPTQAAKLGTTTAEANSTYTFFTEPEFVATKAGGLALILTPGVFNTSPTATQPVIQYGCRIVPVTSLSPTGITLDTDATTGALVTTAKITESDLYAGVNEGPAACTYDPNAINGIIMGRKFENDPTYGFYIYPVNTIVQP